MPLEKISGNFVFNGIHQRYKHFSQVNQCDMTFAIYLPPAALQGVKVPVLYWLSGLTCTDENFMQKAGALKLAAQLGMAIVAPDTSPRGEHVPDDENQAWDFGLGAGFYVNATQDPWASHYQMYSYVCDELPALIESEFNVNDKRSISGHSMGGHGALVVGLKNAKRYQSISAFSPITHPTQCPWGRKAFSHYLGCDEQIWKNWDACELLNVFESSYPSLTCPPIRVDQGEDDNFLAEQLKTAHLIAIADQLDYPIDVKMQAGYDHSYYFIASFIDEHLRFHAKYLVA